MIRRTDSNETKALSPVSIILYPPTKQPKANNQDGDGEFDITEIDITESAITNFQESDITESDITEKGNGYNGI